MRRPCSTASSQLTRPPLWSGITRTSPSPTSLGMSFDDSTSHFCFHQGCVFLPSISHFMGHSWDAGVLACTGCRNVFIFETVLCIYVKMCKSVFLIHYIHFLFFKLSDLPLTVLKQTLIPYLL